ncbi:MAG: hypothetical protein ACTSYD_10890 [Candidatus Heimdallarchaeaceae archaeon]
MLNDIWMKLIFGSKRGISSIISTLVIFTVMISSLALAFSQIVPSLERFQSESDLTTTINTFLTIDAVVKRISNAPSNTSEIIRYNLDTGLLDLNNGSELILFLKSGDTIFFNQTYYLGELVYTITGNYKGLGGTIYDYGSPRIFVYSINRTDSITNIVHQTYNGYREVKLYYNAFVSIEKSSQTSTINVNFVLIHLNTTYSSNGQKEYFPIINQKSKIQICKGEQILEEYNLGEQHDTLIVGGTTNTFSQLIEYPQAPASFNVTLKIVHIYIDLKVIS